MISKISIKWIYVSLGLLLQVLEVAGQPIPPPAMHRLHEVGRSTVPKGRFGSRFSLFYNVAERTIYTGPKGFDRDQAVDFCLSLSMGKALQMQMPTGRAIGLAAWPDSLTSIGQQLSATTLRQTSGGLDFSVQFISPQAVSASLEDVERVKMQIAPSYIIAVTMKANRKLADSLTLRLGPRLTPTDQAKGVALSFWRYNKPTNRLIYPAGQDSSVFALSSHQAKSRHFNMMGYHGLAQQIWLDSGQSTTLYYSWSCYDKGPLLMDATKPVPYQPYYQLLWKNVEEVATYTELNQQALISSSQKIEEFLRGKGVSDSLYWVVGNTLASDQANSYLVHQGGAPAFFLSEGRFRHLSTIDVGMEAEVASFFAPWRLRLQLEQWAKGLTYHTELVPSGLESGKRMSIEGGSAAEMGPLLYHDVGNVPYVYHAEGYDFGPFMPVEQNTSWILLLYYYYKQTGDLEFVRRHASLAYDLALSCDNRDRDGDGVVDVGMGWTTFDVSDALKRSPNNAYLASKQLGAYLALQELLEASIVHSVKRDVSSKVTDADGQTSNANARVLAELATIDNQYLRDRQRAWLDERISRISKFFTNGVFSTELMLLPKDRASRISSLTCVDGMLFPAIFQPGSKPVQAFLAKAKGPLRGTWSASAEDYGHRLSSDNAVTWFSKVIVADLVSTRAGIPTHNSWKAAYSWNINNDQAYQDGTMDGKEAWPGNWYPRGAISLLYLLQGEFGQGRSLRQIWRAHGLHD